MLFHQNGHPGWNTSSALVIFLNYVYTLDNQIGWIVELNRQTWTQAYHSLWWSVFGRCALYEPSHLSGALPFLLGSTRYTGLANWYLSGSSNGPLIASQMINFTSFSSFFSAPSGIEMVIPPSSVSMAFLFNVIISSIESSENSSYFRVDFILFTWDKNFSNVG